MQKRGQGVEHLALYIMAAVVIILIFVFGIGALQSTKEQSYTSTMLQFQTKFSSDLEAIQRNRGSVIEKTYNLDNSIDEVCMVSFDCSFIGDCWDYEIDIIDEMAGPGDEANAYNVFLMPEDNGLPIPLSVSDIIAESIDGSPPGDEISFYQICMPVDGGRLYLQLEGGGSGTIIRPMWMTTNGTTQSMESMRYCEIVEGEIYYIKPNEDC